MADSFVNDVPVENRMAIRLEFMVEQMPPESSQGEDESHVGMH
ncbi:hypothetical protein [Methylobacillus flagellatus]|nr:hypothetical protein [Methylobacillus flagellatus]